MTFASPYWIYSLPVVILLLLFFFYKANKGRLVLLDAFVSKDLREKLLTSFSQKKHTFKQLLVVLGIACLFVALARPQ